MDIAPWAVLREFERKSRGASPEAILVDIALINPMFIGGYLGPLINREENQ